MRTRLRVAVPAPGPGPVEITAVCGRSELARSRAPASVWNAPSCTQYFAVGTSEMFAGGTGGFAVRAAGVVLAAVGRSGFVVSARAVTFRGGSVLARSVFGASVFADSALAAARGTGGVFTPSGRPPPGADSFWGTAAGATRRPGEGSAMTPGDSGEAASG